jgi:hypothetical protein
MRWSRRTSSLPAELPCLQHQLGRRALSWSHTFLTCNLNSVLGECGVRAAAGTLLGAAQHTHDNRPSPSLRSMPRPAMRLAWRLMSSSCTVQWRQSRRLTQLSSPCVHYLMWQQQWQTALSSRGSSWQGQQMGWWHSRVRPNHHHCCPSSKHSHCQTAHHSWWVGGWVHPHLTGWCRQGNMTSTNKEVAGACMATGGVASTHNRTFHPSPPLWLRPVQAAVSTHQAAWAFTPESAGSSHWEPRPAAITREVQVVCGPRYVAGGWWHVGCSWTSPGCVSLPPDKVLNQPPACLPACLPAWPGPGGAAPVPCAPPARQPSPSRSKQPPGPHLPRSASSSSSSSTKTPLADKPVVFHRKIKSSVSPAVRLCSVHKALSDHSSAAAHAPLLMPAQGYGMVQPAIKLGRPPPPPVKVSTRPSTVSTVAK